MAQSLGMDAPIADLSAGELRANFWWMSVCFAVNHGTVTTPLVVATSLLGKDVASIGNGVLYSFTLLASLFLSAPMVSTVGPKASLITGMVLYCIYVGGFALAAFFSSVEALTWLFFVGGSVCGGVAAGVLWTAQGGYFASTATQLAAATGQSREAMTGALSGQFAFVYLIFEVASKLGFSGLQRLNIQPALIGVVYLLLGGLATLCMTRVYRLQSQSAAVSPLAKVWAVTSLWSDPLIWLLSPTNLTFGFAAAFMNGYVNANFASKELDKAVVGLLAAITAATAAVLGQAFGLLSSAAGKGPVIILGALCFMCIPLCLFVLNCCGGWGWWLICLYLLQGSGRAVYESTNRAMFSDFFTGPATEGAFANCMFQSSVSFALCFFLQTVLDGRTLAGIVLALAAVTPLAYWGASTVRARRQRKEPLVPPVDPRTLGA